ncbi:MAG: GC-type dockerin domain-anchored protein [Phycisphaerales bacterium]|jgi:hypothetical protein|nr:GC-type dockerin domain-anchored protein [Phycisphaerales bacterium]
MWTTPPASRTPARLGLAIAMLAATGALAQPLIVYSAAQPNRDRWNYPFNGTPGTRTTASTFAALDVTGFDNLDAQFIVGFDTGGEIPTGLPLNQYRIVSAHLTASIANDVAIYDPSFDPVASYFATGAPGAIADADAGRPCVVYATGYRNGFTLTTWQEPSAFGTGCSPLEPFDCRNAFAALWDASGSVRNVSNYIREGVEATPYAVGQVPGQTPGTVLDFDTTMEFDLNVCDPGLRRFLQESLAAGRVHLTIASTQPASGGVGGPTSDPNYPQWYTRENILAQPPFDLTPTLEIVVMAGNVADWTGEGQVNSSDFLAYLNDYATQAPAADLNGDCLWNSSDFLEYLNDYASF